MLQNVAKQDSLFAASLKKPNKNLKDCCAHVINTVKKMGKNALTDQEVLGIAMHYYDEDSIKVGEAAKCTIATTYPIDGDTSKPMKTIKAADKEEPAAAPKPAAPKPAKKGSSTEGMNSLFDML